MTTENQQPYKVLTVDDCPANLAILSEILSEIYEVQEADCGAKALEATSAFRPDIVLLDVMMPDMDGFEVCRRIRATPEGMLTKILMVSARAAVQDRLDGYDAGADDYITKPFDEDELLSKLRVFEKLTRAEEVDRQKGAALSWVSSKLKHPLRCITLPAETIQDERNMPDDQRRRFAEIIHAKTRLLQEFFSKVEFLSAIHTGRWSPSLTRESVTDVVRESVKATRFHAFERDIEIEERYSTTSEALIDRSSLRHVFDGLVLNAIQLSPDGGRVTVSVESKEAAIIVSVSDQGDGMDLESVPQLFAPFVDTSPNSWASRPGDQLTLALAAALVEKQGGQIGVQSDVVERDRVFQVQLPQSMASEEKVMQ